MMWDAFAGNAPKKHRSRSRSRSPQPPMPSGSNFPQQHSPTDDPIYGGPVIPSPTYGQFLAQEFLRGRSSSPQLQPPVLTHVVHVIHHKAHRSHKRHSHSHSDLKTPVSPPTASDPTYQTLSSTDYFAQSYGHGQPSPSSHQPSPTLAFPTPHISPSLPPPPRGMQFSYSEPTQVQTQRTVLKKPRPPKLSYSQSYSQAQVYSSSYTQPQPPAYQYYSASHAQPEGKPAKQHSQSQSHTHSKSSSRPPKLTYIPRPSGAAQHPAFEYSKCNGRRRALCIGINYLGQPNELRGCINDATHVREFLRKQGNYRSSEIMMLTDNASDPRLHPTRTNIIAAMRWLVRDACQNDALFLHYSGHGGQTRDLDGDEADGFDEVIYPLDFKTEGHITDDEMHEIMVSPLPHGCRLTALFDACHSGTVLDLPYIYSPHGRLKGAHVSPQWLQKKSTPADVISWSGCADEQTSADTFQGGVAVGAMSHAFISALKTQPIQTYQQLLTSVRHILHPRYSQKPQLGSSHHIDTNLQFIF